jgi:peptidoglycan hydrolase-like protein with peptidoglycan-binding domain
MIGKATTQQKNKTSCFPLPCGILQRKCTSCGQQTIAGEQCENCRQTAATKPVKPSPAIEAEWRPAEESRHLVNLTHIPIQAKLRLGQPNDRYEQEADLVAEQVMRMPDLQLQRVCSECEEELQRQPIEKEGDKSPPSLPVQQITPLVQRQTAPIAEESEEALQTKPAAGHVSNVSSSLQNRITALRGQGQPLSQSQQAFFSTRFGADFSQVRLHHDSQAADLASAVDAQAFTVGRDIVFGAGHYQPGTSKGQHLLAHELTHVIQQGRSSTSLQRQVQTPTSVLPRLISESLGQNSDLQLILMGKNPPLRRGDQGKAVEDVQLALMKLDGNALPKYGADGDFGGETEAAIVDFQVANGLLIEKISEHTPESAEEGAVDPITLREMDGQCNHREQIYESDEDIDLTDKKIEYAMQQNIIYNRLLGFAERDDWPEPIGSPTYVWRVAKYQKENGLEIDGIMGEGTWTVRGVELGIDVSTELANWRSVRSDTVAIEVPINDFTHQGIQKIKNLLAPKAHSDRVKQLINQARPQLNKIKAEELSQYKKRGYTKVSVHVDYSLASGSSSIDIYIGEWLDKSNSTECSFAQCPVAPEAPTYPSPPKPSPFPQLQQPPEIKAKCRGACGADCPPICKRLGNLTRWVTDDNGKCFTKCVYKNVLSCYTHPGCREHDKCYDFAVSRGESISGPIHRICDYKCIKQHNLENCITWSGKLSKTPGVPDYGPSDGQLHYASEVTPVKTDFLNSIPENEKGYDVKPPYKQY